MEKLFATAVMFAIGLWLWAEYFREIPHLQQAGVLKNFQVTSIEPHQAEYRVLSTKFYSPQRRMLHPASPVIGSYEDLAYLSVVDVLLAEPHVPDVALKQVKLDQTARCFNIQAKDHQQTDFEPYRLGIQHLSLIAETDALTQAIRALKKHQRIQLVGDWVEVHSVKTHKAYYVGFGSAQSQQCHLFLVKQIIRLN